MPSEKSVAKRLDVVWFLLRDILEKVKTVGPEIRSEIARNEEWGNRNGGIWGMMEVLYSLRMFITGLYRLLNASPHPGNYISKNGEFYCV